MQSLGGLFLIPLQDFSYRLVIICSSGDTNPSLELCCGFFVLGNVGTKITLLDIENKEGRREGKGMKWETGIDIYTLLILCIK